jgi:hypothetical protein
MISAEGLSDKKPKPSPNKISCTKRLSGKLKFDYRYLMVKREFHVL